METVYIYVIGQECGPVKVGISQKPWTRVATIGTSSPFKVFLLYCYPTKCRAHAKCYEQEFHDIHCDVRLWGEWFNITSGQAIKSIQDSLDIEYPFEEIQSQLKEENEEEDGHNGGHP